MLVEEDVGGGSIAVGSVFALEEAEGDECVEKIACRAGMQAEAAGEGLKGLGALGEFGEDFHFDGAKKSFGGPESEAGLQDVIGRDGWRGDLRCDCGCGHAYTFVCDLARWVSADREVQTAGELTHPLRRATRGDPLALGLWSDTSVYDGKFG